MESCLPDDQPELSLIIPSFLQATTITEEIERLHALLVVLEPHHELIVVIDGNEDGTAEVIAEGLAPGCLRAVCFPQNQGKGVALRHGLTLARGRLVAFLDAGGDLDATELRRFLAVQVLYDADVVIGSKRHSLSDVVYPWRRRFYSRTYQLLNRVLFSLRVRDTQVGMKLFRREVLAAVIPRLLVKRFAFDLELLVVAHHLGFRRIVEAPVRLRHGFSSSISWRAVVQTLWDTLAIFYRLRILQWYDEPRSYIPPPRMVVAQRRTAPARLPVQETALSGVHVPLRARGRRGPRAGR